jgi:alkylation response protein AidB-like acyl-CoA dehydrogenase
VIEWSDQHRMIRDAVRRFVEAEVVPRIEELEHGDLPPYDILRKLVSTFGMDEMARARFARQLEKERAAAADGSRPSKRPKGARSEPQASEAEGTEAAGRGDSAALQLIPIIELCRYCPGLVTAMGVSMGLTAAAILAKGTPRQKERWALPLLTFEKIGAWAITEPGSGSDAFGSMKSTARRDGQGGYLLNGSKTFITNGPWADILVFICKLDEPEVPRPRVASSPSWSRRAPRGSSSRSRCARWGSTPRRPVRSFCATCASVSSTCSARTSRRASRSPAPARPSRSNAPA